MSIKYWKFVKKPFLQISIHMYIRYIYRYFSRLDYVVSTTYISYESKRKRRFVSFTIHDQLVFLGSSRAYIYMCKRYLPVTRKSSVGSSQVRETCRISLNTSMLFIGGEVTFRTDLANRMRAHTVLRIQAVYVSLYRCSQGARGERSWLPPWFLPWNDSCSSKPCTICYERQEGWACFPWAMFNEPIWRSPGSLEREGRKPRSETLIALKNTYRFLISFFLEKGNGTLGASVSVSISR